jgi:hypothetical protein
MNNSPATIAIIASLISAIGAVISACVKEKNYKPITGCGVVFVGSLGFLWFMLHENPQKCAHMFLSSSRQGMAEVLNTVSSDLSNFSNTNTPPPYSVLLEHGKTVERSVAQARHEIDFVKKTLQGAADRECFQTSSAYDKIDRDIVQSLESVNDKTSQPDLQLVRTKVSGALPDIIKGLNDK